jgi:curved DNA-binding protein CbpA
MSFSITHNPFFVLGLEADASAIDVERAGKKLLLELELGKKSALTFLSPFGEAPRTADEVRQAMATLRDPRWRSVYARFAPPRTTWPTAGDAPASATSAADDMDTAILALSNDEVTAPPWWRRWMAPARDATPDAAGHATSRTRANRSPR